MPTYSFQNPTSSRPHPPRGSAYVWVLGIGLIVVLLIAGLWVASQMAGKFLAQGKARQSDLQQKLNSTIAKAMAEAEAEMREDDRQVNSPPDTASLANQSPTAAASRGGGGVVDPLLTDDKISWTAQVNAFVANEILAPTPSDPASASGSYDLSTLDGRLLRAVNVLDADENFHPAVKSALRTTLAASFLSLNRLDDARLQCETALDQLQRAFGPRHAYVDLARENLAAVHIKQGHYDHAAILYEALLESRLFALGVEHPDTLRTLQIISLLREAEMRVIPGETPDTIPPPITSLGLLDPPCCSIHLLEF